MEEREAGRKKKKGYGEREGKSREERKLGRRIKKG